MNYYKRLFTPNKARKKEQRRIVLSTANKKAIDNSIKMAKIKRLFQKHNEEIKKIDEGK